MDATAFLEYLESLGFTPSAGKPEIGKEVGRQWARSYDDRVSSRGGRIALEKM